MHDPLVDGGDKPTLRASILRGRAGRTATEVESAAQAIAAHLAGAAFAQVPVVTAYLSMGSEPGTHHLLDALTQRGTCVLLPVSRPDRTLDWVRHTPDAPLTRSSIGVSEPVGARLGPHAVTRAGLVIVPALAVDHAGWRLGRGAGFFDRALAAHTHGPVCALVYADELVPHVPHESHDVPVDLVVTEAGIFRVPRP